jgi:hypothetical protein
VKWGWFSRRYRRQTSIEAQAEIWMERHGPYAYELAGERALDAYLLGDLGEQKRWHLIRGEILERVEPNAALEDITQLLLMRERYGRRD